MEQSCQDKNVKIAIVGGGPSGIYCAINLLKVFKENSFYNYSITIFDRAQVLRTILPTGGGRCNITNSISDIDDFLSNYPRGKRFLRSVFSRHFNFDSIDFFKSIGIDTYVQNDNRIFPKSNSSKDVKDKMLSCLKEFSNVKIINLEINSKEQLKGYDYIVISSGSRYSENIINSFNQPMIPFKQALSGLVVKDFCYPVGVSVKSLDGDFVFTKDGIAGPLAFKISSIKAMDKFPYDVSIRLFDVDELINLIKENSKKTIGVIVSKLIPKSLASVIIKPFDKKASEVSKKDLINYSKLDLTILSNNKLGEIVNAGGVDLKFVDKNCKSKIQDNLWFCGEILDIDGFCGGFNLQNCWSTAYVVALDIAKRCLSN